MLRINHDIQTGEVTEVSLTKNEIDELQKLAEKFAAEQTAQAEAMAAHETQKAALLAKLGITADEAKLLLS
jgi:hypothetical protein